MKTKKIEQPETKTCLGCGKQMPVDKFYRLLPHKHPLFKKGCRNDNDKLYGRRRDSTIYNVVFSVDAVYKVAKAVYLDMTVNGVSSVVYEIKKNAGVSLMFIGYKSDQKVARLLAKGARNEKAVAAFKARNDYWFDEATSLWRRTSKVSD